jgi:phage terminase small subunit
MTKNGGLTPKQEAFCLAYVETGSSADSYRAAYDTAAMKPTTVRVKASELLADPGVAARVKELRTTRQALLDDRFIALKERVIQEYVKIAFAELRHVASWDRDGIVLIASDELDDAASAALAEVSQGQHGPKVKQHSKPAALDALVRILGMAVEKKEITGKDGAPLMPEHTDRDVARVIYSILREASIKKDEPQ